MVEYSSIYDIDLLPSQEKNYTQEFPRRLFNFAADFILKYRLVLINIIINYNINTSRCS